MWDEWNGIQVRHELNIRDNPLGSGDLDEEANEVRLQGSALCVSQVGGTFHTPSCGVLF